MLIRRLKRFIKRLTLRPDGVSPRGRYVAPGERAPVYVFIRSWNRPLYLWACLDSLYRNTRTPCRFVLIDNASSDPMVAEIIAGFERRGMFHAVHRMTVNHGNNQAEIFAHHRTAMGEYFVLVDGDVAVEASSPDWLEHMLAPAERDPQLGAVGSVVDTADFVDPEWAYRVAPQLEPQHIDQLIKARSPERRLTQTTAELINPFPPAGRLLLLRTQSIDAVGLPIGNRRLCEALAGGGYRVGIATRARHRHLSLLNFFDYPSYDFKQLNRYLQGA